ncbi:hypothetical protein GLOIN_2v1486965 [Rhizophagus irregularis DAOM 181602=DAOM 197198]|nr:hypothetical protein GLOIN_2v1486965 [Rhizophagus irregularis DAOM 181602=DAOM 197198]
MPRIYTLNDVGNSNSSKLGSPPSNRYLPSRLELEEQLKKDREKFIRSAKQLIAKYHALDKKNKCMQSALDASYEENESIQNDLDHSYEENVRMQKSMNQMISLANQLNGLNNKLVSQITCEQKSHANLNAKQLKEIESLKSTVKSLKSIIFLIQKDSSLKDSDIISLGTKINELEAELEQAIRKVLLKNSNTNQLYSNLSLKIKAKELENELEKVTQNLSFKDGLIFCLRSRVSSAEADPVSSSNDYKHDEVVEEIPHFSSHYSEREPDGKEDYDSIPAIPVIALGGNSNTLVNDQKIIPLIFFFVILAFTVILIIWHIYRRFFHPTKKKEIFYPDYRNKSYGFPIQYTEEPKDRTTPYETLPYGYG